MNSVEKIMISAADFYLKTGQSKKIKKCNLKKMGNPPMKVTN